MRPQRIKSHKIEYGDNEGRDHKLVLTIIDATGFDHHFDGPPTDFLDLAETIRRYLAPTPQDKVVDSLARIESLLRCSDGNAGTAC